jgi:hypothetical protein
VGLESADRPAVWLSDASVSVAEVQGRPDNLEYTDYLYPADAGYWQSDYPG